MEYEDFNDNEALEELQKSGQSVMLSTLEALQNWGRSNSVWPLTFATRPATTLLALVLKCIVLRLGRPM